MKKIVKKKPDRELINHYIERLKSGEAIEKIYDEMVDEEYYHHDVLEREEWLSTALYNLAYACVASEINLGEKNGLDYLKNTIGYVNTELLIYPIIHYENEYLAQLPNAYTEDKDGFTRAGILNATVNCFINEELPHRYNLSSDEKIVADDPEYREKYPMFYVGEASELYIMHAINDFVAYAAFTLGQVFQEGKLPEDYLRLCGETIVGFVNYMLNKLKNFAIFLTDDQHAPELPYHTLTELIDNYNICNHKVQMDRLKDFLVKVGTYYKKLQNGQKLKEIYGQRDSLVSMLSAVFDLKIDSKLIPLAYAYAKKMEKNGKVPTSGIPEIDIAIAKMKER